MITYHLTWYLLASIVMAFVRMYQHREGQGCGFRLMFGRGAYFMVPLLYCCYLMVWPIQSYKK